MSTPEKSEPPANEPLETEVKSLTVALKNLYLDPNNYRFIDAQEYKHVGDDKLIDADVQRRTTVFILGEKQENVRDLLDSFHKNGWLPVDQIQVRKISKGKYLVVEGNRRVATLKFLERRYQDSAVDLGKLATSIFEAVPVNSYPFADDAHHLVLMGLKHISGNKKWPAINQAKLMKALQEQHGMASDDVCKAIGVSKREFNLSLRTLALAKFYEESDYGDQFRPEKYNIFREVLNSPSLRDWIEWDDTTKAAKNNSNIARLFSLVSTEAEPEGEEETGDRVREPAITTGSQMRELGKIVNDPKAVAILERTRSLAQATLGSDVLATNGIKRALSLLEDQANVLFTHVRHVNGEDLGEAEAIARKLQGLAVAKNQRPDVTFVDDGVDRAPYNVILRRHFSSITVDRYKGLSNVTFSDFRRINLFAGMNNAGKTSVLEAIYLLTQQNEVRALLEVITRRGKVGKSAEPKWLLQQVPDGSRIHGVFDDIPDSRTDLQVDIHPDSSDVEDKTYYRGTIAIQAKFSGREQSSETHIFDNKDRRTAYNGNLVLCRAVLSSPFSMHDPDVLVKLYDRSVEKKSKERIVAFLRDKVDSGILDIELTSDDKRFRVPHRDFPLSPDLTQFGEGLQRIFHIALLFAYAENGVVLVDELENAIHTTLLLDFTRFLQDLAVEFNVQLFLTSHSKECIDAFVQNGYRLEDVSAYSLARRGTETVCFHRNGEQMSELLDLGDFDIRRMR